MKLGALDHPKTLDFASRLGVELPTAIGHLELLWAFAGTKTPQGNIGKWPDGSIAMACHWRGPPAQFVETLVAAGFVDRSDAYRLLIHDWHEHAQSWVRMKLAKAKLSFLTTVAIVEPIAMETAEPSVEQPVDGSPEGLTRARVPRHATPRHATPRHAQEGRADESFDRDAFLRVQAAYPAFSGRQSDWALAERACQQRIEEGASWDELEAGARRFASFVAAGGRSGPRYVDLPSKFFDNGLWRETWDPPPSKGQIRQDKNVDAAQQWLSENGEQT